MRGWGLRHLWPLVVLLLAVAALGAVREDLNWREQHTRGLTHATREVLRGVVAALAAAPAWAKEEEQDESHMPQLPAGAGEGGAGWTTS